MILVKCTECGSTELNDEGGYVVCVYCKQKFYPNAAGSLIESSNISLHEDIKSLLEKCASNPENSIKLANLVLDLDPGNVEAIEYIKRGRRS